MNTNVFLFQVNLKGDKVRRQFPIGDVPNDVDERTVYVVNKECYV